MPPAAAIRIVVWLNLYVSFAKVNDVVQTPGATGGPVRPVGQSSLREINLAAVLGAIFSSGQPLSRAGIAEATGLAKATVSTLVDQLVDAGFLSELAPLQPSRAGRPATPLVPRSGSLVGVGLEVNVDYLGLQAIDLTGHTVAEAVVERNFAGSDPDRVLAELGELCSAVTAGLVEKGMTVVGVRLALPGLVRPGSGTLEVAPNLGWRDLEPVVLLGLPQFEVEVRNEAKLAGLAQTPLPAAVADPDDADLPDSFLYVSGDVGVGSAIVLERALYQGRHGWSGEIGHLVVEPGGRPCSCGSRGCLEQYAGKSALLVGAGLGADGSWSDLLDRLENLDPASIGSLTTAGKALGQALGDALNLLDVPAVVLGGCYAEVFDHLAPVVAPIISERVLSSSWEPISVLPAAVVARAALAGGAREALREARRWPSRWLVPGSEA